MTSPYTQERTVVVPVQFLVDREEFFRLSAEAGRDAGMDGDWVPPSLHEAVYENLISTTDTEDSGMVVRPAHWARTTAVFTTEVYVGLLQDPNSMVRSYGEHIPKGFDPTLDNLMLGLLNLQAPPVDFGFEIIDSQAPWSGLSAHEIIEEANRMMGWRYEGATTETIFVP